MREKNGEVSLKKMKIIRITQHELILAYIP